MGQEFASIHKILFKTVHCLPSLTIIDGRPIASRGIIEEFESILVVIGDLDCVNSFNIIHIIEHMIVLGLPWFDPEID